MSPRRLRLPLLLIVSFVFTLAALSGPVRAATPSGHVLQLFGHCMVSSEGSTLTVCFAGNPVTFKEGDVLEYDVLIPKNAVPLQAGVGIERRGQTLLGETWRQQTTRRAAGHWAHRTAALDGLAGQTLSRWQLVMESPAAGDFVVYFAQAQVRRADGSTLTLYQDGPPPINEFGKATGFSEQYLLSAVDAEEVSPAGYRRPDMALVAYARNISKSTNMDFYEPLRLTAIGGQALPGSKLEYDVYLPPSTTQPRVAMDLFLPNSMNSMKWTVPTFKEGATPEAVGHWFHKVIPLPAQLIGQPIGDLAIDFEADAFGDYAAFFDNIVLTHNGQVVGSFYSDGPSTFRGFGVIFGYSNYAYLGDVPREQVPALAADPQLYAKLQGRLEAIKAYKALQDELEFAGKALNEAGDAGKLNGVRAHLSAMGPQQLEDRSADNFQKQLQGIRDELAQSVKDVAAARHTDLQKYTDHLVGHAHIDLAWTWTWQHTIEKIIPETFGSALNFMKEYPDFTFSQSSPALYQATEQHYPEMFARIRKYVAEGRWELLGGRWCEGDENMLLGEAHARQFLTGQQYFQSRFGRIATVGWEPDTFGHTAQMPQMLRKSGIDTYYYTRISPGSVLFQWEALDGSRVLAFNDQSGYSGSIDTPSMRKAFWFKEKTGLNDQMVVYGVGNHGGGPTRESIDTGHAIQKSPILPKLKLTTAREAFDAMKKNLDPKMAPVVKGEINTTFVGCYTSVCDIKWWNRKLSERLPALESLRVAANRYANTPYPQTELTKLWQDLCYSHHHDTICGSATDDSYKYTRALLLEDWTQCKKLEQEALITLAYKMKPSHHRDVLRQVTLFNGTGFARKDLVLLDAEQVGAQPGENLIATDAQGNMAPTQWVDERTAASTIKPRLACLVNLPACGWTRLDLMKAGAVEREPALGVHEEGGQMVLESPSLQVRIDKNSGAIISMIDRVNHHETLTPGKGARLIDIHEADNEMSAWDLGKFLSTEEMPKTTAVRISARGPLKVAVEVEYSWRASKIYHEIALQDGNSQVDITTSFDWQEQGSDKDGARLVKFAVPLAIPGDKTYYEIPFGWIERPASMGEVPALRWAARSDGAWTAGLLNDSRHGHDLVGGELRLSLIRSSHNPNPVPNQGWQTTRYAIFTRPGAFDPFWLTRQGEAYNELTARLVTPPAKAHGNLPLEQSLVTVNTPGMILSAYKQAEDGQGYVARVYNVWNKAAEARLGFDYPVGAAQSLDLIERPAAQEPVPTHKEKEVSRQAGAHEIVTLRVAPEPKKPWWCHW